MIENANFRIELQLFYLKQLMEANKKEEFNSIFESIKGALKGYISQITSSSKLELVRNLLAYRKKVVDNVIEVI